MDFIAGKAYQNASGIFSVLSVKPETLTLRYASGPQAGHVLVKRIADMSKLATTETLIETPPAVAQAPARSTARRTTTSRPRA